MTGNSSALRPFLDRLLLRSKLTLAEQRAVLDLSFTPIVVAAQQDYVGLNDHVDHISMVAQGALGAFGQDRRGHRQFTAIHLPGDMVNLKSIVMAGTASPLQALPATNVLSVSKVEVAQLAETHPNVGRAFWRDFVVDAAITSQWLINIGLLSARGRIAHFLCELAMREGSGLCESFRLNTRILQSQLGEVTGITSVHTNRVLADLKAEGVIEFKAGVGYLVHQWTKLKKAGAFDPRYLQLGAFASPSVPANG